MSSRGKREVGVDRNGGVVESRIVLRGRAQSTLRGGDFGGRDGRVRFGNWGNPRVWYTERRSRQ